jgi:hypothetical protein
VAFNLFRIAGGGGGGGCGGGGGGGGGGGASELGPAQGGDGAGRGGELGPAQVLFGKLGAGAARRARDRRCARRGELGADAGRGAVADGGVARNLAGGGRAEGGGC